MNKELAGGVAELYLKGKDLKVLIEEAKNLRNRNRLEGIKRHHKGGVVEYYHNLLFKEW